MQQNILFPQPERLIVLVGPTASGKTALALQLAQQLNGEIVNADSRQIFRQMEIGTAKPSPAEQQLVPHHLIDVVAPDEPFTLADYQQSAQKAISDIAQRGRQPILVGGTGLYIRALVDGLAIPTVPPQPEQRQAWEDLAATEGVAAVHRLLQQCDPQAAATIPATNVRRVIRALEVTTATGQPFSSQQQRLPPPYPSIILGLNTERARLYSWADMRVDAMIKNGLVAEVAALVAAGYSWDLPAMSSLGYRQIGQYLCNEMSLAAAIERLKFDTHGFIRKQLVWFRPDQRINWLDAADPTLLQQAQTILAGKNT